MSVFRMVKDWKIETVEVDLEADSPTWSEVYTIESPEILASSPTHITINGKRFPVESVNGDSDVMGITADPETQRAIMEWVDSGHRIITVPSYPTCPTCGATGDDDWDYCPYDGAELTPAGEPERYEVDRYGKRVEPGENDA